MKIALVLDDSIDRTDGVQQYVRALGSHLSTLGHEVHYLCSTSESTDPRVHALARSAGVTFNGNGMRTPLPASRSAIRELLSREMFDVIHVQTPHSPFLAARVVDEARRLQARSVRIVATFHILPHGRVSALGTSLLGRVLRSNLRRFDDFCAVSAPAAQFALETFGIECRVIAIGIDLEWFASRVTAQRPARGPDDRLVLAFLGRLVARKGVLELVEALSRLNPESLARLDVRIGGKGPLLGDVEAAVASRGLERSVSLRGFVAEDDKPQFFADADIAVFPATGGESFGIVLIEAMASGAGVVLAGANPGYLSVIGDGADVSVDARDADAFAAVLTRLITNPDIRDRIHAEQATRVKAFDLNVVGRRILDLYQVP